jgi:hypothetical protein
MITGTGGQAEGSDTRATCLAWRCRQGLPLWQQPPMSRTVT